MEDEKQREAQYFVSIEERATQELIPTLNPVAKKPCASRHANPVLEYRPLEYLYIPTRQFIRSICGALTFYESYKVEDSTRGKIEVKVRKATRGLIMWHFFITSSRRCARRRACRKTAQKRAIAEVNRDTVMATLAGFEQMAQDLDRARLLPRLMDEIAASKAAPAELVESQELMALMANTNPHGRLW